MARNSNGKTKTTFENFLHPDMATIAIVFEFFTLVDFFNYVGRYVLIWFWMFHK